MTPSLDRTFAALADPTRRAILARLAAGEATVSELTAGFAISQPAVSRHLRVLEQAGLIAAGRAAQRRPRRLRAAALRQAGDWVWQFRAGWDESLDQLDDYLRDIQSGSREDRP